MAAAALVTMLGLTLPAFAKKVPRAYRAPVWSERYGTAPIKCVQRSYSISVGNPAFRHRRWPYPCF